MQEKSIKIDGVNPVEIFGVNDSKLSKIRAYFPKLKIVARGTLVKVMGNLDEINFFEKKLAAIIQYYEKFGRLNEDNIEEVILKSDQEIRETFKGDDGVLVHGNGGLKVKAKTPNQVKLVESCGKNDLVFAVGPAGSGKTYTAVALAVKALKNKEVKRIILTRPAVEAGENLGFLPGDLKEKLDPYLLPLYDALRDMIMPEKLGYYFENGIIEIAPLAFMRGRTLDKAFVILDEAQNSTEAQIKMFLTRMGKSAKFVITGDLTQIDLPPRQKSGLKKALHILRDVDGIGIVELDGGDVIRHKLVKRVINAFEKEDKAEA